jgi:hypothetical protein
MVLIRAPSEDESHHIEVSDSRRPNRRLLNSVIFLVELSRSAKPAANPAGQCMHPTPEGLSAAAPGKANGQMNRKRPCDPVNPSCQTRNLGEASWYNMGWLWFYSKVDENRGSTRIDATTQTGSAWLQTLMAWWWHVW